MTKVLYSHLVFFGKHGFSLQVDKKPDTTFISVCSLYSQEMVNIALTKNRGDHVYKHLSIWAFMSVQKLMRKQQFIASWVWWAWLFLARILGFSVLISVSYLATGAVTFWSVVITVRNQNNLYAKQSYLTPEVTFNLPNMHESGISFLNKLMTRQQIHISQHVKLFF